MSKSQKQSKTRSTPKFGKQNKPAPTDKTVLTELFSLIYSEGLWHRLTPETAGKGAALYKEVTGEDLHAPRIGGMKLTMEEHLQLAYAVLPMSTKQTDFWKIVVQITWLMNAVEKDPFMAKMITESKTPEEFFRAMEAKVEV